MLRTNNSPHRGDERNRLLQERELVPLDGETSNELLEVFNDWGAHLNTTEITELLKDEPEIGGPQP